MWVHSFILLKAYQVSTFTLHVMEHVTLCYILLTEICLQENELLGPKFKNS